MDFYNFFIEEIKDENLYFMINNDIRANCIKRHIEIIKNELNILLTEQAAALCGDVCCCEIENNKVANNDLLGSCVCTTDDYI